MIRCELVKNEIATCGCIEVKALSPVTSMCRKLKKLGYADDTVEFYRGEMLCMVVKSLFLGATVVVHENNKLTLSKYTEFTPKLKTLLTNG